MTRWLVLAAALLALPVQAQERQSLVTTQVRVGGEVRNELTLGVEDLRAAATRSGAIEARGYTGVRLADLLDSADIRRDAPHALRRTYVVATASDGFQAVFSWAELYLTPVGRGVIVAFERDGQPLRDGEGRFALVSLADERPGFRHVKWLSRIEVRRAPDSWICTIGPMARYPGLTLRVLADHGPAIGPGKARLVALIAATGSISAAAREMGMSYRRAWLLVEELNTSFTEPVVITAVGGKRGGGAEVTELGRKLVARFGAMEERASAAIAGDLRFFNRRLRKPKRP